MRRQSPIHYAWVIALSAMLVVLCAVGLAQFAFGMVLPTMARDLALDYTAQVAWRELLRRLSSGRNDAMDCPDLAPDACA